MTVPESHPAPESYPTSVPRRAETGPVEDEMGLVDRQADPATWLSGRALVIIVAAGVLALIITVVVCVLVWATPPLQPLQIPTEPQF